MDNPTHREMNQAIQAFFDAHAANWDADLSSEFFERLGQIVAELDIAPGSRVLDVGAGTGVLFPLLAPRVGEGGLIVAVDISGAMLREAQAKGRRMRVACLEADIMDLPMNAPGFDWVICNSCFPHFLDQARGLQQLAAVLKPSGQLVICHTQSRAAINDLHRTVGGTVGGHKLPDDRAMKTLIADAHLDLLPMEDRADRYLVLAQKPTP